jgi:alkyldihydroxyacetonephosphate synthase
VSERRRKWWGWGYEDDGVDEGAFLRLLEALRRILRVTELADRDPPALETLRVPPSRIAVPAHLAAVLTDARLDRVSHAYGKAFVDVVRALDGDVSNPPDVVAYPRDEAEISELFAYCEKEHVALIPFGGGSSVVGGVEPPTDGYRASIALDMRHLDRVLEVDEASRLALVEAGVFGPALEDALRERGLTLRHFPQSFEFSTVGGWIATRAAGHFATGPTRIDDAVAGVRIVTPRGVLDVAPLPSSGAGPEPARLVLGSEGTLGVITRAWLRVRPIPRHRASVSVDFASPEDGLAALRAIAQSGLQPANCRVVSPLEAALTGLGDGRATKMLLAFESHDHDVQHGMDRALAICREAGGSGDGGGESATAAESLPGDAAASRWRSSFLHAPYIRDRLVRRGLVVETFETATTWTAFGALHDAVQQAVESTIAAAGLRGIVTWRVSYAYPDGPAPYYTVVATSAPARAIETWTAIKRAASDAILAHGGTITHHHAVGRTHRPWFEAERGPVWLATLEGAKRALDPEWILNPGVLLPVPRARH